LVSAPNPTPRLPLDFNTSITIKKQMNFILLVDGDNINPTKMGDILDDIHKRGNLKICRIYADFSTST